MIVKHFGCTAIHNKALYKCLIHSFTRTKKKKDSPFLNLQNQKCLFLIKKALFIVSDLHFLNIILHV